VPVRHIEFIHTDHFENNYHRYYVRGRLSRFIDFFWQTRFEKLWTKYPSGFSDALFPNLGYTYLINLGTPFEMQVDENRSPVRSDAFLPRLHHLECFHRPGNVLFGIKFKVSPVILEKKVNFSEYNGSVSPLSYLADPVMLKAVKATASFEMRTELLTAYFLEKLKGHEGSFKPAGIVTALLDKAAKQKRFDVSVELMAARHHISTRTLQRYFLSCTGVNSKQAMQVLRIRHAVSYILSGNGNFNSRDYGYYDHSHFYRHLKQFLHRETLRDLKPHLHLLRSVRQSKIPLIKHNT